MRGLRFGLVFVIGTSLIGCGSVVKHSQVSERLSQIKMYSYALKEVKISVKKESKYLPKKIIPELVKTYLEAELVKLSSSISGESNGNVLIMVDIVDYRDKGGLSRFFWGPFSGADYLESNAYLIDGKTGEDLGMVRVKSEDAWGIGMDGVAKMHARKIANVLQDIRARQS